MGIFDRFSQLLKSNINDLISRAEDPEKMLTQILADMRGQLVKAKQQVASAIADEKRLRDQADAEYKQAQDWERRAMLAVQEGRDDMAKQALVRQGEHLSHGEQLEKGAATASVDNQLLALKQKMGILPPPSAAQNRALNAGQRNDETVHAEIEHAGDEDKQ